MAAIREAPAIGNVNAQLRDLGYSRSVTLIHSLKSVTIASELAMFIHLDFRKEEVN